MLRYELHFECPKVIKKGNDKKLQFIVKYIQQIIYVKNF